MSASGSSQPPDGDDDVAASSGADDERDASEKDRASPDFAWLLARERGEPTLPTLDPQRAAAYEKLQGLIAALPEESVPAAWNEAVLAEIRAGRADSPLSSQDPGKARARRKRFFIGAAGALAAAVALLLWLRTRSDLPEVLERGVLVVSLQHHPGTRSAVAAGEAALGDELIIEAPVDQVDELRIYRDDREVVARCPDPRGAAAGACQQLQGRWILRLALEAPGRYRAVGLRPASTGSPSGNLADDLSSCQCQPRTTTPIVAR